MEGLWKLEPQPQGFGFSAVWTLNPESFPWKPDFMTFRCIARTRNIHRAVISSHAHDVSIVIRCPFTARTCRLTAIVHILQHTRCVSGVPQRRVYISLRDERPLWLVRKVCYFLICCCRREIRLPTFYDRKLCTILLFGQVLLRFLEAAFLTEK